MTNLNGRAPAGHRYAYIVWDEQWHAREPEHRIVIARESDQGGAAWEFNIVSHADRLRRIQSGTYLRVEIFDDAWQAFTEIPELFAALAERKPPTLDALRGLLDELGLVDTTRRVQWAGA